MSGPTGPDDPYLGERMWGVKDVCRYFSVSPKTVYRWTEQQGKHEPPPPGVRRADIDGPAAMKIGGQWRWFPQTCRDWAWSQRATNIEVPSPPRRRPREEDDRLMTAQEVADELGFDISAILGMRDRGTIPEPILIDGQLRWDKQEVENRNGRVRE